MLESTRGNTVNYEYNILVNGDLLTSYHGSESLVYDNCGLPVMWFKHGPNVSPLSYILQWYDLRLTAVTDIDTGEMYTYKYNDQGIRTEKKVDGVTHKYYLQGEKIIAERYGSNLLKFYYDTTGVCGFNYNGTDYYFQKNILGDILRVYSNGGTLYAEYSYDAWGKCTIKNNVNNIATINPFRYRGYYYDEEISLYYLNARYYDPEVGRFISADSIDYLAPETINGINLFAYCMNNPVMGYDPDGTLEWWQKLLIGLAFIVVGAVVTAATAGTGTGFVAAFGAALLTSAKAVAVSTAISAGIGFIAGGISSGSFDGAVDGLLNGAIDGFMWGGIFAGGSQILSAGFKGLAKLGLPTGRKGGIAKTGILSPDKLRTVEDISRIAQRGQAFYDYGGTILKFGKYAHIDVSTKSFLHLHLWFTHAHLPLGTVLAGFIGGF